MSFMDATKVSSSNIHPRGHSWPLIIKTNGWVVLACVRGAQKEKRVVRATADDEGEEEEENSARVLERATIMATSSTATAVRRLATKLAPSSTITVSGMLVFFFLRGKRFLLCT
jgi:hypothetical protein